MNIEPTKKTASEVEQAVRCFPARPVGGLSGLWLQKLKECLIKPSSCAAQQILLTPTDFVNHFLSKNVPFDITPTFGGATLSAFCKKDGEITPPADREFLRRLQAECIAKRLSSFPKVPCTTPPGFFCSSWC